MTCPACLDAQRGKAVVEDHGAFRMHRCPGCGLEFASPMAAAPAGAYDSLKSGVRWEFDQLLRQHPGPGRSLLDVGCGDGRFLALARDAGYEVTGVDFNGRLLEAARAVFALDDLHVGTVEQYAPDWRGRFDVITAFHVLEHVEVPHSFVRALGALLKPGGLLAVAVPNVERAFLQFYREPWDYPPHHLTRWTAASIQALFSAAGLSNPVISIERISLRALARYRDAYGDYFYLGERPLLDAAKRIAPYRLCEVSRRTAGESRDLPAAVAGPKALAKAGFHAAGFVVGAAILVALVGRPGLTMFATAQRGAA